MTSDSRLDTAAARGDVDDAQDDHLDGLRRAGLPVVDRRHLPAVGERYSTVDVLESALSPATRDAYEAGWRRFMGWCAAHGIREPVEVSARDVADWVTAHVNQGHTPSYLRRELAGVRHHLVRHGVVDPPTDHPGVRQAVAGATRIRGEAQRRAAPLGLDDMRTIVNGIAIVNNRKLHHPTVVRDRALVALGWALAQRAGNLVALDVDDLRFTDDGLLVFIRRSKTDQTGRGLHIAVPWSHLESTCPVRAAMTLGRERKTGPLFRHIDRHRRHRGRLSVEGVTIILRTHVADILQRDPAPYSSHSLRAGFVTEARARGVPDHAIMRRTGHTSASSLHRYDRPADLLDDASVSGGVVVKEGDICDE